MPERLTLTVPEAGELLGIGRGTAYEAAKSGQLPGVIRIGRRLLVSRAALLSALGEVPSDGNGTGATVPLTDDATVLETPGYGEPY